MRLLLLLTLLFATTCTQISADNVAMIKGKSEYATLRDAVAAAKDGDTITMIADYDATSDVSISKKLTLDLNGKTITSCISSSYATIITMNHDGELTIIDCDVNAQGGITVDKDSYTKDDIILLVVNGRLVINGGNFTIPHKFKNGGCVISVKEGDEGKIHYIGNLTINKGYLSTVYGNESGIAGVINNSGVTTITGGTIENTYTSGINARALNNTGILTILGGKVISKENAVWTNKNGALILGNGANITGGIEKSGGVTPIEEFILTDNADFNLSKPYTASKVSYNRGKGNAFGTICLPFVPEQQEKITYYKMRDSDGSSLTLERVSEIEANTPYVYYAEDGEYNVSSATTTTLEANASALTTQNDEGWLLKGVYRRSTVFANEEMGYDDSDASHILEPDSYYIKDGGFSRGNGYFSIKPFRAYFTAPNESGSNRYEISIYDELTAVRSLEEGSAGILSICNMEGKKLSSLQKGINIVKFSTGKSGKIIVK